MAAFSPGASPPPVRTPMRKATCDPFAERLGLRFLLLPLERLLELFRADGAHDREDLAKPARMAARFVEALPLERLGQLLVREDALLDEVLAEGLDGRRLTQEAAKRVDEVDRPEWLDQVMRGARGEASLAVGRAVARGQHDYGDLLRGRIFLEELADVEPRWATSLVEVHVQEHRSWRIAMGEVDGL